MCQHGCLRACLCARVYAVHVHAGRLRVFTRVCPQSARLHPPELDDRPDRRLDLEASESETGALPHEPVLVVQTADKSVTHILPSDSRARERDGGHRLHVVVLVLEQIQQYVNDVIATVPACRDEKSRKCLSCLTYHTALYILT